jgi:hypothetical protein
MVERETQGGSTVIVRTQKIGGREVTAAELKDAARRAGVDVDDPRRYGSGSFARTWPFLWADEWRLVRRELGAEGR